MCLWVGNSIWIIAIIFLILKKNKWYRWSWKNHPNKFRRTFACNMLKQSDLMTVANLLGHSKLDTTKIYLELDESKSEYECNKRVIF